MNVLQSSLLVATSADCRTLMLRVAGLFVLLACASCAPRLMKLPSGNGIPVPDLSVLAEATAACRAVSTITAEVGVTGSVGGRALRGRLLAGLAAPASARLEAVAPFGQPLFILAASGDNATLFLPRDGRVLERGRPEAVLEAIAGVPLDAAALRNALTGCSSGVDAGVARAFGDDWQVVGSRVADLYVHRESRATMWRLVAVVHRQPGRPSWRAEFSDFQNGPSRSLPRSVRLTTTDSNGFDLRLTMSQVEINAPLDANVFQVRVPPGTKPITLEELRQSGPLGPRPDGQ